MRIYITKIDGGDAGTFYSGIGSHDLKYIEQYCDLVRSFIKERNVHSVCDLGCGDFNVASKIISDDIQYEGVDIVRKMIVSHNNKYAKDNVKFTCLDIVNDELPDADLCLVRQVLQHLSNSEVMRFLGKIKKYKWVIVTEHVTEKEFAKEYNIDKIHGINTRNAYESGVYLDEPPFNICVERLLSIPCRENQVIITDLISGDCIKI